MDKVEIPLWTRCSARTAEKVHFFRGIQKSFPTTTRASTRITTTTTNEPFLRPRHWSLAVKNLSHPDILLLSPTEKDYIKDLNQFFVLFFQYIFLNSNVKVWLSRFELMIADDRKAYYLWSPRVERILPATFPTSHFGTFNTAPLRMVIESENFAT